MTKEEQHESRQSLLSYCQTVTEIKGKDYSSDTDVLSNFKIIAEKTGLTKYQVWLVYASKHIIAIEQAIKRNPQFPLAASESVYSRIVDAINYMLLLNDLMEEEYQENNINKPEIIPTVTGDDASIF